MLHGNEMDDFSSLLTKANSIIFHVNIPISFLHFHNLFFSIQVSCMVVCSS